MTRLHLDCSANEGEHSRCEHERQIVDTGFDWARVEDALEVGRKLVQEDDVAAHEQELVRRSGRE